MPTLSRPEPLPYRFLSPLRTAPPLLPLPLPP